MRRRVRVRALLFACIRHIVPIDGNRYTRTSRTFLVRMSACAMRPSARVCVYVRCDRLQLCMRNLRLRVCRQWYAGHAAATATATPKHANDFGFVWLLSCTHRFVAFMACPITKCGSLRVVIVCLIYVLRCVRVCVCVRCAHIYSRCEFSVLAAYGCSARTSDSPLSPTWKMNSFEK